MTLADFYEDVAKPRGGKWIRLAEVGDKVVGTIIDIEVRDRRTPDGEVVANKKTGKPRKEYVVTLEIDDREDDEDDGIRKVSCNESAQDAVRDAFNKAGGGDISGARFALQLVGAAPDKFSQAKYACSIKKSAKPVTVPSIDELI